MLIKVNQIGPLGKTLEAMELARMEESWSTTAGLRVAGFTIFYMGINLGDRFGNSVASPSRSHRATALLI